MEEISIRKKFRKIKNYAVYYGRGREEELAEFDMVIVEPQGQDKNTIKSMQNKETLVLAYVSTVEINESSSFYKLLREEDFLRLDGERVMNREYNNFLVDITSKRWRALLIHYMGDLLVNRAYDGIFLDTIGDLEFDIFPWEQKNKLFNGAYDLMMEMRNTFKDYIVVQNNGLINLCNITVKLIDGVCWENPPLNEEKDLPWVKAIIEKLQLMWKDEGIKALLLFQDFEIGHENDMKIIEQIGDKEGVVVYTAPHGYLGGVNLAKTME